MNQPIYLVVGAPGSGKTWVLNQLQDKFYVLEHDDFADIKTYQANIRMLQQLADKPILIETPFSVSQFMSEFKLTAVFIIETPEVTRKRYEAREGKPIPQGHLTRINTYIDRARELRAFSGTSQQVLEHLKEVVK